MTSPEEKKKIFLTCAVQLRAVAGAPFCFLKLVLPALTSCEHQIWGDEDIINC